jgi:hypothetical protein
VTGLGIDPNGLPPAEELLALLNVAEATATARAREAEFLGRKLYAAEAERTELGDLGRRLALAITVTLIRLAELSRPTDLGRVAELHWSDDDEPQAPEELEELWTAVEEWRAWWIEREAR